MNTTQLREERRAKIDAMRATHAITTGAAARALTSAERAQFDADEARAVEITNVLEDHADQKELSDLRAIAPASRRATTKPAYAEFDAGSLGGGFSGDSRELGDGVAFRSLKPEERLSSLPIPVEDRAKAEAAKGISLGRVVRGLATGRWDGAERERRAMSETLSAGGYLVPTPLADDVIDLARGYAVVFQAGARTVPMDSKTLSIAKVTADPTAQWLAENAAATPSDLTFGEVKLTAQKLVILCKMSVELIEDAGNVDEVVNNAIAQKIALELDRVALNGSGTSPEPRGILNTSGINSVTSSGFAALSWSHIVNMESELVTDNTLRGRLSYICDGVGLKNLKSIQKATSTGIFLMDPDGKMNGYPVGITNQLPTTSSLHRMIFGNFDDLLIGLRRELVLEVSRVAADSASSAFTNVQVWIRGYIRADVQLALPQSFCAIVDL